MAISLSSVTPSPTPAWCASASTKASLAVGSESSAAARRAWWRGASGSTRTNSSNASEYLWSSGSCVDGKIKKNKPERCKLVCVNVGDGHWGTTRHRCPQAFLRKVVGRHARSSFMPRARRVSSQLPLRVHHDEVYDGTGRNARVWPRQRLWPRQCMVEPATRAKLGSLCSGWS